MERRYKIESFYKENRETEERLGVFTLRTMMTSFSAENFGFVAKQ